jgi:hypothetical protein
MHRVRRLCAGELQGDERARAAAHVLVCERCRAAERELEMERARLLAEVPFDRFASGVAERLARSQRPARLLRWLPAAAAACVLLAVGVPLALHERPVADDGVRSKGEALVQLYLRDARGVHIWQGEPVSEQADVQAELRPGARPFAAAVLSEGGQVHALFAGLARTPDGKPRVLAFGWTGAHGALLAVALSDKPIDLQALSRSVQAAGAQARLQGADVASVTLAR